MRRLLPLVTALVLLSAACAGDDADPSPASTASPDATTPEAGSTTSGAGAAAPSGVIVDEDPALPDLLAQATEPWGTDWTRRTIELDELLLGIRAVDPRDRIRPLDAPRFSDLEATTEWLPDDQPGVVVVVDGDARFYPLTILTRHEIVNDQIGAVPISVTYCPLCNTSVVFDRRFEGETLRLGVSGLLRKSDMVMWDDATTSLWQQVSGVGIVGTHAGKALTIIASRTMSLGAFGDAHPGGRALSQEQEFGSTYLVNPYLAYSSRDAPFGYFTDEPDPRRPALERVVGVEAGGEVAGYPFGDLAEVRLVNDEIGGVPIVVMWGDDDAVDNLDASDPTNSEAVGSGVAYLATVGGRTLTFVPGEDGTFIDGETESTWSFDGRAIAGPLEGEQLEVAVHRNEFFFAWAAFFPDGRLFEVSSG